MPKVHETKQAGPPAPSSITKCRKRLHEKENLSYKEMEDVVLLQENDNIEGNSSSDAAEDDDDIVKGLKNLMPQALQTLNEMGVVREWLTLISLLAEGKFPKINISFRLFLGVVRWLSTDNAHGMKSLSTRGSIYWTESPPSNYYIGGSTCMTSMYRVV